MDKTKKILMIASLSALAVACIMLILAVFKVPIFTGIQLRILLIVGTVAISCGIAINEVSVIKRKKILGYVGLGLLALSVVMALVIFCSKLLVTYSVFNKITGIVSISSVLFIVVISLYSKLGKSMLGLQIPTYVSLISFGIILALLIAGVKIFEITGMLQIFIVLIIVTVGLLVACSVVSARRKNVISEKNDKDLITITKTEYDGLKRQIEYLQSELNKYKNQ